MLSGNQVETGWKKRENRIFGQNGVSGHKIWQSTTLVPNTQYLQHIFLGHTIVFNRPEMSKVLRPRDTFKFEEIIARKTKKSLKTDHNVNAT